MDLQTRKLTFVKEFLNIQSEDIVDRFEKMLKKEKIRSNEKDFQPMTLDEFYKRIDQSMLDSENDKLTSIDELIKEIEGWG
ncbi:MAG: hypothetical protein Q8M67_04660 [Bacteroidota bacterium]|nr:hypothetical protein [Bacteroidota bacterium]